ncbi:MAG: hypothetical protein ACLPN6_18940 [Streptosporangiaceae bacterium]
MPLATRLPVGPAFRSARAVRYRVPAIRPVAGCGTPVAAVACSRSRAVTSLVLALAGLWAAVTGRVSPAAGGWPVTGIAPLVGTVPALRAAVTGRVAPAPGGWPVTGIAPLVGTVPALRAAVTGRRVVPAPGDWPVTGIAPPVRAVSALAGIAARVPPPPARWRTTAVTTGVSPAAGLRLAAAA